MKKESNVIYFAIFMNMFLSLMQIVFGFIGNSRAVVADGIHTFSYLVTNVMGAIGDQISRRPANRSHPFGYGIVQYITAVLIGFFILVVGFLIIVNILTISVLQPSLIVLAVIMFSIICKQVLARFLRKQAVETENAIIEALAKETTSDGISSIVVLVLVSLTWLVGISEIFAYMDSVAGFIIALFIIFTGVELIFANMSNIIGCKEDCRIRKKAIKEAILVVDDVEEVDNLVILKYGPYANLYVDVKLKGSLTLRVINNRIKKIKSAIRKVDKKIKYITVNPAPK